eukprot:COSAG06_NODE_17986_length_909_cov_147.408642_1_plen_117_part_10
MQEYFNTFGGNPVACAVGLEVLSVCENGIFEPFIYKYDLFTKTGSGQTCGKTQNNTVFSQVIRDEGLQENAAEVGEYVLDLLEDMKSVHGSIGDVRGAEKPLLAMSLYGTKSNVCQD